MFKGFINGKEYENQQDFLLAMTEAMSNMTNSFEMSYKFTDTVNDTKNETVDEIKPVISIGDLYPSLTDRIVSQFFIDNVNKITDKNKSNLIKEIKEYLDEFDSRVDTLNYEIKECSRQIKTHEKELEEINKDVEYYKELLSYLESGDNVSNDTCQDESVKESGETMDKISVKDVLNLVNGFDNFLAGIGFWDKKI